MGMDKNVTFNVSGGQLNVASESATINATQNNGVSGDELDSIVKNILENLSELKKENAEGIIDIIDITKEELAKSQPKVSRLRNCVTLIAPMMTIANGIPVLATNLQKLQEFIMPFIK
ncbi:hypothetical protein [[Clostridium] fimetarium]|uniref:Uncharacterized protein n=1 Tax=[Clostridium] fimetarium TaxID=99656 RepID=A0A1I0M4V9_9FIRM|nr:hypothetical protein [[Clostridium] fimetarium]SEV83158.1 hypothetical protein SAMN05421659_101173 [[Clostridium] fimetarium]